MSAVTDGYSDYLQSLTWDYFATVTFRTPRRDPIRAGNSVWGVVHKAGVQRAFLAVEPHETGDLHIHGLLKMPDEMFDRQDYARSDLRAGRAYDLWRSVFNVFGRSKVEMVHSPYDVSQYCSKYVVKETKHQDCYNFYGQAGLWQPIH
ncbi:hypothetical protein ES703_118689 [subsurface metagenome]